MNTETPTPRLVPDRPSDIARAVREVAGLIQSEAFAYPTANTHTPRIIELCQRLCLLAREIDAAAPPAEAPAERGELLAEFLWNRFADENEIDWSDAHSKGQWRLIAGDALAMLAAAPAAPAVGLTIADVESALKVWRGANGGIFTIHGCAVDLHRLIESRYTAPRVTGGREAKPCTACEGSRVLPHDGSECPFCDAALQAANGGEG